MNRWYVVHSHPREEARAFGHLTRQGFDAWLPYRRTIRRHARRTEAVLRPLFPRYLFVRVDLAAERWRPILSTSGVQALVSGGDAPLPVADETIDGLQARALRDSWEEWIVLVTIHDDEPLGVAERVALEDLESVLDDAHA